MKTRQHREAFLYTIRRSANAESQLNLTNMQPIADTLAQGSRTEAVRCFLKLRTKSMHEPVHLQKPGVRRPAVEVSEVHNSFMAALDQLEPQIEVFERSKRWLPVLSLHTD